jgi:hypothetical protein
MRGIEHVSMKQSERRRYGWQGVIKIGLERREYQDVD